jgi:cytochrome c oxidase cbb3-type subunit 3
MKAWITVAILLLSISAVDAASIEAGSKLYGDFCAACHGTEGKGVPNVFPALNDQNFLKAKDDKFIKDTISNGKPGTAMIAWSKDKGGSLDEAQIDDLVAFIRNWEAKEAAPSPVEKPGAEKKEPTLLGEELFNANCAACHGEGGVGAPAGPALVGNEFVAKSDAAAVKKVVEGGRVEKGMPAWKGVLSDEQIDSLVTLVKGWKKEEIGVHVPQWDIGLLVFGLLFAIMLLVYIYKIT